MGIGSWPGFENIDTGPFLAQVYIGRRDLSWKLEDMSVDEKKILLPRIGQTIFLGCDDQLRNFLKKGGLVTVDAIRYFTSSAKGITHVYVQFDEFLHNGYSRLAVEWGYCGFPGDKRQEVLAHMFKLRPPKFKKSSINELQIEEICFKI